MSKVDMIPEIKEYLAEVRKKNPPSQNNAYRITRENLERILRLNPISTQKLLEEMYDIWLDPDISPSDYGEPQINNED